jgi:hypothetical protein
VRGPAHPGPIVLSYPYQSLQDAFRFTLPTVFPREQDSNAALGHLAPKDRRNGVDPVSRGPIGSPAGPKHVTRGPIETPAGAEDVSRGPIETPAGAEDVSRGPIETPAGAEDVSRGPIGSPAGVVKVASPPSARRAGVLRTTRRTNDPPSRSTRVQALPRGSLASLRGLAARLAKLQRSTDERRTTADRAKLRDTDDEAEGDEHEDDAGSAPPSSVLRHFPRREPASPAELDRFNSDFHILDHAYKGIVWLELSSHDINPASVLQLHQDGFTNLFARKDRRALGPGDREAPPLHHHERVSRAAYGAPCAASTSRRNRSRSTASALSGNRRSCAARSTSARSYAPASSAQRAALSRSFSSPRPGSPFAAVVPAVLPLAAGAGVSFGLATLGAASTAAAVRASRTAVTTGSVGGARARRKARPTPPGHAKADARTCE